MTEPSTKEEQNSGPDGEGRIPRPAIWVVVAGLVLSAIVYGISFLPGSGSLEVKWDTVEPLESPPARNVGGASFELARPTLSALAPNEEGLLLYRVAAVTRIDSGRNVDTSVRCDIYSRSDEDTRLARSTKLRAAWPKPSEDLDRQDVPETSTVKFFTGDTKKVDLPIRDVIQRYTDSTAHTEVEWPGYNDEFQTFIWNMKRGTGVATASMPWVAIFEAYDRPRGEIECTARFGDERTQMKLPFLQQEWPITDDQPNADDVDTGEASNVE